MVLDILDLASPLRVARVSNGFAKTLRAIVFSSEYIDKEKEKACYCGGSIIEVSLLLNPLLLSSLYVSTSLLRSSVV